MELNVTTADIIEVKYTIHNPPQTLAYNENLPERTAKDSLLKVRESLRFGNLGSFPEHDIFIGTERANRLYAALTKAKELNWF